MNIGICFLTTNKKINNPIVNYIKTNLDNYINSVNNLNKHYELYRLLETDENDLIDDYTISFKFDELKKKYGVDFFKFKEFVGVCHLPLFYFYDLHPEYDYYIFHEDDLLYTGFLFENNINPFNIIPFENYNILFLYDRIPANNWYWNSNSTLYNIPEKWTPYEGLLNCYIISNKALKELKDFCTNYSWYGHHELLINSFFLNQQGKYKIGSIKKYIPCYINWQEATTYQDLFFKELSEYCFVHPIKNDRMLNYVKSKYNNHIT